MQNRSNFKLRRCFTVNNMLIHIASIGVRESASGFSRVMHVQQEVLHKVNLTPQIKRERFCPILITIGTSPSGTFPYFGILKLFKDGDGLTRPSILGFWLTSGQKHLCIIGINEFNDPFGVNVITQRQIVPLEFQYFSSW